MYKTEFADVRFKACDNHEAPQFICTLESGPRSNTILHDEMDFRIQLKPGIPFEEAEAITDYLNERIDAISVTYNTNRHR